MLDKKQKEIGLIVLGIFLLLLVVIFFVNSSMEDISNSESLHEDQNVLLISDDTVTGNTKKVLTAAWDPETLTAQQLEKVLKFGAKETTLTELKNVENNMLYNRNPAAVLFYLAHGYTQLGEQEKALDLYKRLRAEYKNGQITLYVFDIDRVAADDRFYSVSVYEESLLRQAALKKEQDLLSSLRYSGAKYGIYKKEQFLYADLAAEAQLNLKDSRNFLQSYDRFVRLAYAKKNINNLLIEMSKKEQKDSAIYLTEELRPKTAYYENLVSAKVAKVVAGEASFKFDFKGLKKSGLIYYYTYADINNGLEITVRDNGEDVLVSELLIVAEKAVPTPAEVSVTEEDEGV